MKGHAHDYLHGAFDRDASHKLDRELDGGRDLGYRTIVKRHASEKKSRTLAVHRSEEDSSVHHGGHMNDLGYRYHASSSDDH